MKKSIFIKMLAASFLLWPALSSAESDLNLKPIRLFGSFEFGALEDYTYKNFQKGNFEFLQRSSVYLLQQAEFGESWQTNMGVGVSYFTVIVDRPLISGALTRRSGGGITQLSTKYTLGGNDAENPRFRGELGIFPFKYNKDASNLGEYMFRTMVSPQIIFTGGLDVVGNAAAYLTGAHFDGYLAPGLHWDAFWTFQMDGPPLKSQSFTLMFDYSLMNGFLEFGTGFQLQNFIYNSKAELEPEGRGESMVVSSIDNLTGETRNWSLAPLTDNSQAFCYNCNPDTTSPDINMRYTHGIRMEDSVLTHPFQTIGYDTTVVVAGVPGASEYFPRWTVTDTTTMSFGGTKVMGRFSMNLQSLLQLDNMNPNDMTFYMEAILIGTKEIPFWAETWQERTPIMFGFNLPTFKLLDALSFEMEYFPHKFPLNFDYILEDHLPVTNYLEPTYLQNAYDKDDWKFTVYARKSINESFVIHGQIARDHFRAMDYEAKMEYAEFTQQDGENGIFDLGDFYWMFKFQYIF